MTDGLHNRVGQPNENSMSTTGDPVDNLTLATSFLKDTAWSAAGVPRVDRLYAVGLSQTTYHQSLLNLVSLMNRGVPTAGGAVPPGYINYADASRNLSAGNQLAQFFTKVLWDYLGYTEYVDPIVNVSPANVYSRTVQIAGANQVVLVVGWQNANAAVTASLINPATGQSIGACQRSTFSVACLADAGALKGLTSVEVRAFARLDTQVMIEVATRNTLRAEPRLPKLVYNTGDSIPFQVALRLAGLPIVANANTSIKVTANLVQPAGALGTVLGNAKVTKGALDAALGANKDLTPAAAKLSLLGRDQLPGYRSPPTLELRDDGKSGDGAAGDGVFGVLVPANLPGLYQLTAQAAMGSVFTGWRGGYCTGAATCVVRADDAKFITAEFTSLAGPFELTGVRSRATHGAVPQERAVDHLQAINASPTVESRVSGAGHQIVFQFSGNVSVAGTASVVDANNQPAGSATPTPVANEVLVSVTGVADGARVRVKLDGVNGSLNVSAPLVFLIGDADGNRSVNSIDRDAIKARAGQLANSGNQQYDINRSGRITAADIAAAKARNGRAAP